MKKNVWGIYGNGVNEKYFMCSCVLGFLCFWVLAFFSSTSRIGEERRRGEEEKGRRGEGEKRRRGEGEEGRRSIEVKECRGVRGTAYPFYRSPSKLNGITALIVVI